MCTLYYYANHYNLIVCGTSDKSELLIGYFTKYGDGGVDILPLGDVYKTQVRKLAKALGIPEKIIRKPSSPRLWPGQLAEEELGLRYEEIDAILYHYVDLKYSIDDIIKKLPISRDKILRVLNMMKSTEHKRKLPPYPKISSK